MGRLDIRNVNDEVLAKLDDMARKRKMTRTEFVRVTLADITQAAEIRAIENKYENLVLMMVEVMEQCNRSLRELNERLATYEEDI